MFPFYLFLFWDKAEVTSSLPGVHGHIDHAKALLKTLKSLGAPPAFLHFFSDGRDTRPTSGGGLFLFTFSLNKMLPSIQFIRVNLGNSG